MLLRLSTTSDPLLALRGGGVKGKGREKKRRKEKRVGRPATSTKFLVTAIDDDNDWLLTVVWRGL